jgi:glycosyltransferase involved in cell wall biosynthesis
VSVRPTAIVVATHGRGRAARASAAAATGAGGADCWVLDVDGCYAPVGDERVVTFRDLVRSAALEEEARTALATLEPDELDLYAGIVGVSAALGEGATAVVLLAAGVVVLDELTGFAASAGSGLAVLPHTDSSGLGRPRTAGGLSHAAEFGPVREPESDGPLFSRSLVAFGGSAGLDRLRALAADWRTAVGALDGFAATTVARTLADPALLLSAWRGAQGGVVGRDADGRLTLDDRRVLAVDLSRLDPAKPWILDPASSERPVLLLSEHPALAGLVEQVATTWREWPEDADEPARLRFDAILRQEARRATLLGGPLPDLLDAPDADGIEAWALEPVPAAHPRPVARYLLGVRAVRADVRDAFPHVPGPGSARLGEWGIQHGVNARNVDPDLVRRAGEVTLAAQLPEQPRGRRPEGVNLVGYLSGELGLGVSGRLVDAALHAAGEATSTFDVSRRLVSRQSAAYRVSEPVLYDTTLLCVNGGETHDVIKQLGNVTRGTTRIGMWYWELEEFYPGHVGGFDHVDEVWAATDFMRDSIAAKSPGVPVRTVMPPLPQREGEAGELPARFGIDPSRPWFLFTFDFLSLAGRKNPYGLVEAFERAFPAPSPGGPQLVVKTINGEHAAADLERLRLQMADRDDLILIEEYLPNDERHVLVAHCTAFVSLHRAEGLGLTLAEAMAWGKPVVATRYGGVVQFMDDENSLLVGWAPGVVPEQTGPYAQGLRWADPDLDEAAALMRRIVADPAWAAAIGERAARDIRELHNLEVAGARMREALAEARAAKRAAKSAARAERAAERAAEARPTARATGPTPAASTLARRVASRARRRLRRASDADGG